jgi:hypothetical protein
VKTLCGCTVPVNNLNSESAQRYLAALEAASDCDVACTAVVCQDPDNAYCAANGNFSTMGICRIATISPF